jgi:hypothetical protein
MHPKVFCIGFQKTGTSSLGAALRALGYRVHKGFRFNLPGKVQIPEPVTLSALAKVALPMVEDYSAFEDNPWCLLYRELDAAYPGSKFILTRRSMHAWADSLVRHFRGERDPMFRFIYGCNDALAEPRRHYLDIYHQHNDAVLSYFSSRPDDLLVFDLESANWADLCAFLGRRKPLFRPYPHRNAAAERERRAALKRQREFGHM